MRTKYITAIPILLSIAACGTEIAPAPTIFVIEAQGGAGGCPDQGGEGGDNPHERACPGGCGRCGDCVEGECVPTQDAYRPCRLKAGACDLVEICDGTSIECPADEIVGEGQWPGEYADPDCGGYMCDGVSKHCPASCVDQFDCFPGHFCDAELQECISTSEL